MKITRRYFIASAGAAAAVPVLPHLAAQAQQTPAAAPPATKPGTPPFSFDTIQTIAAQLATTNYQDQPDQLPAELKNLDYDHYRAISYRQDKAMWHDSGLFQVQFFHRGFIYGTKVTVNTVENGIAAPVAYDPSGFDYGNNKFPQPLPADLGFAGFRVHFPLNTSAKYDEVIVFQGASYFRVLGRNQQYGLSARGLAIDTAEPEGEEFPVFTQFWIVKPGADDTSITVYALLDSKSTTGAYRFVVTPDAATTVDIDAVLYPRLDIKKLGFAPLTSMYLHGKPEARPFADIRPEDHDSDGLQIHTGAGEWIWRQLLNPTQLRVSSFTDLHPNGFGLFQRDRNFADYQDLVDIQEKRPSYWIEPQGDWGAGVVQLVEIPSDDDVNDNMVAYWVPETPVKADQPVRITYRLNAFLDSPKTPPVGRAVATWTGPVQAVDASHSPASSPELFEIDFTSEDVAGISDTLPVLVHVTPSSGTITNVQARKLPTGSWRASFIFTAATKNDTELRAFLSLYGKPLTETWIYRWSPS